jgi:putative oxidoreductase
VSQGSLKSDLGLLIARVGTGLSLLLFHGYGKISGGPETWERVGGNMQNLGIDFLPVFWGFMAAMSEFFGALFLVLGLFFRPAAALLAFTMFVAALRHLSLPPEAAGAGWKGASHALELLAVFTALFILGPGRIALSRVLPVPFRRRPAEPAEPEA